MDNGIYGALFGAVTSYRFPMATCTNIEECHNQIMFGKNKNSTLLNAGYEYGLTWLSLVWFAFFCLVWGGLVCFSLVYFGLIWFSWFGLI